MRFRKQRFGVALASLGILLGLSLAVRRWAQAPIVQPGDLPPPGWWRLSLEEITAPAPSEEVARQLSLPYSAGTIPPEPGKTGVVALDPEGALPGYRLYVSGHGPEAILIDRQGQVRHRWRLPFRRAFPDRHESSETAFFRCAELQPDGSLLVLFQGGGLVRLDPKSRPLWRLPVTSFNNFWVSPDGEELLFLEKQPISGPGGTALEDYAVAIDRHGRERWRFSIQQVLERSSYRGVLEPPGPTADRLHSNRIARLGPAEVVGSPFRAGDLLLSLREIDTLAVVHGTTHEVLWARRGPYRRQHAPILFPGGRLLVFDNQGEGIHSSRILELELATDSVRRLWPPEGARFSSAQAGALHALPQGHLLVVESERGRAYELNQNFQVVWEFRSPHRTGIRREYVATLFDVIFLGETHPGLAALPLLQPR